MLLYYDEVLLYRFILLFHVLQNCRVLAITPIHEEKFMK